MSISIQDAATPRPAKPTPETSDSVFAQLSMKGKTVVVTGAADGIGLAAIEAVAEAGANVVLCYNSNPAAIEKAKQIGEKYGVKAEAYQLQVSDAAAVEAGVKKIADDFGRIDVFVANAGAGTSKSVLDTTIEEYKQTMAVNGGSSLLLKQNRGC